MEVAGSNVTKRIKKVWFTNFPKPQDPESKRLALLTIGMEWMWRAWSKSILLSRWSLFSISRWYLRWTLLFCLQACGWPLDCFIGLNQSTLWACLTRAGRHKMIRLLAFQGSLWYRLWSWPLSSSMWRRLTIQWWKNYTLPFRLPIVWTFWYIYLQFAWYSGYKCM